MATVLAEDVVSALGDLTDALNLGLDLTDIVGDAVGLGLLESSWFVALAGSVSLASQAFFVWQAINLYVEAAEYDQRVAESAGAAAGVVALAVGQPIPAAPSSWLDPDRKLANAFRAWAGNSQNRAKSILEYVRPHRLHGIVVQVGVGEISSSTLKSRAIAMIALLLACRKNPSESMDQLFHKFAETNVPSMGEPYDSMLRNRHYWWPPL
jgi:hypothetical protein